MSEKKESWPYHNDGELRAAGYVFDRTAVCRGENCRKVIEWWRTPKQKYIPLDPGTMQPHFSTCPNAKDFRSGR